jgi:hypothetical protein
LPCKDVATKTLLCVEDYSSAWSVEDYSSADLELLKPVVDQHRFVTSMFWQQANFFVVIQGALLSVLASQVLNKGPKQLTPLLLLSALGLVLAVFWGLVAWNRVWIIEKWIGQVRHLDREVDRHLVYESVEKALEEKRWYRKPTHMTRFLPWLLALGWIALLIWPPVTHNLLS